MKFGGQFCNVKDEHRVLNNVTGVHEEDCVLWRQTVATLPSRMVGI